MAAFLALTGTGSHWPAFFPASYAIKTFVAAALLWAMRRHYSKIRWNGAVWGVLIGIVAAVQWIGMESLLLHYWPNYPPMTKEVFDPSTHFSSARWMWSFIAVRWAGASLLVPVMEELFWRDYLWRTLLAPNDFKLAHIGEWNLRVFVLVAVFFGAGEHLEWMTGIVCGLIYGALLVRTRSLGALIIAHAVTNFLLGAYVLHTHQWFFW
jgi:CAAX prenyl protease-like protein